jgi:hypothetical protein
MTPLVLFENVNLSVDSKFKYVLLQLRNGINVVRGDAAAEFHADVAEKANLPDAVVLGGGRIQIKGKKIKIYGHSIGFPWKNGISLNSKVSEIVAEELPNFQVEWSDGGY